MRRHSKPANGKQNSNLIIIFKISGIVEWRRMDFGWKLMMDLCPPEAEWMGLIPKLRWVILWLFWSFPLLMEYSSQIPINFSFHCQMSLPVIFVPNFSASDISKLGGQFEFVDPLNAQRPICPLFGAGNNQVGHFFTSINYHLFSQILPIPTCGFRDKEGNSPLSGILYCARVQLWAIFPHKLIFFAF